MGNRVGAIHELTEVRDWLWLTTKMNVADDATREWKTELSSENRWWRGPEILRSTTLPEFEIPIDEDHSDLELKKEFLRVTVEVPAIPVPLSPVLDDNDLLRMDSRLANVRIANMRTPVIMDPRHYLTKRCWSECPSYKIRRAKPSTPVMGVLPEYRVEPQQQSFSIVGMGYFVPMEVSVGRRHEKRYGVLFTCMTTPAIHLKVAQTTYSFIMAIWRMICRRGIPWEIFSDNGTSLRGADKELQQALDDYDQEALTENMNSKGIKWNFIPPSAPHMGGSWERSVKSVKTAMLVILRYRCPKDEELLTLILEVVVNIRPLTDVPLDPAAPGAITPMHFLIGTSSIGHPPEQFDDADLRPDKR
ncbi:hypothetical protein LAZ67_18000906 [Cordylochernes scorpioides]|uniref:Integrase catalytic domain-containing protein n=1 Tax=Cordylochernes scorpioides TaxID=51811 RepID=A0ABY6LHU8_9ARAC|nr:hypothetical protein LAZ67_18000906 [Cordylochernes scorpioides]